MNGTASPLISVIVPVFDVAEQIGAAMASLLGQTLTDFEVIVIDDGSTDGSGAVAETAVAGDARFRFIRQANRGLSGARNAGLALARGAFVAFLDGDDAFEPRFLADLHAAIEREGTDWAACAVLLTYPDESARMHPAIHASTGPETARTIALTDAREVARQFPSAWNKLYRRALFDGLAYPEGSWFEDHEVFWALAARAPALAYVPEPLYRHRRERMGQITGADSDRVFEQLRVLDRLYPLIMASGMSNPHEGYARLATRLVHERALALRDRRRRAQFLTGVVALFERLGVLWSPDWDPEISRGLGLALAGEIPLSVVLLGDAQAALPGVLAQTMADFELVVVGRTLPAGLPPDLPVQHLEAPVTLAALAEALQGRWVLLLGAGETLLPDGAMRLVNLGEASKARLAMGGFERATLGYHDGWTDNTRVATDLDALPVHGGLIPLGARPALFLYPLLANRVIRRDLLAGMQPDLRVPAGIAAVQAVVLSSALVAHKAGYTRLAVAGAPDRPVAVPGLLRARRQIAAFPGEPALPRGWRGVLFLRLVRLRRGRGVLRWPLALALALFARWLSAEQDVRADPETPRWVHAALRLFRRAR
ncbi:glycosyltransferase family 2 protein [Pararhodobacter zhoushanensis]|uniref:glycosyltransferase family 2 protein n=1 Tax=Pararhodobacter zhoushanensis TaxID=2479545 RepID=UPI000F8F1037|nr:glycosyltransferase family 2 protein [Pararhodobacter zhoushanensis]